MADPVFAEFCAAGLWPGLGRTLAAELADGGIRSPAEVSAAALGALPRVSPQRAGRLLSSFIAAGPVYEVVELLVPAGVDARLAGRAVDALGPGASRLLRDDPWRLLDLPGVTVGDADRVARAALPGVTRADPRRARALVGHVLARAARDGHTVVTLDRTMDALVGFDVGDPQAAVAAAVDSGIVVALEPDEPDEPDDDGVGDGRGEGRGDADGAGDGDDAGAGPGDGGVVGDGGERVLLCLTRYAEAEDAVAQGVARLVATAEPIALPRSVRAGRGGVAQDADLMAGLDEAQRAAVTAALSSGVSVLTGGPGTGKSRTVATLVALAEKAGRSVALAAPTGRAAKRLEQLCDSPASTLHRLLGAQPRTSGSEGVRFDGGFTRGEDFPLEEDVVVVDEASMLDAELAEALLAACADGTHLVFVGDAAQLPSIGAGRVLGDLIDSGRVPVTELRTLYRQAEGGAIARLAAAVREGELPPVADPTHEVVVVPCQGSAQAAHRVVQLVTDSIPRVFGVAPDQVQVVTPVHRGGAGTQALNAALKAVLNPPPPGRGGGRPGRFDVGDRVVATANHLEAEPNGFANGEVGTVSAVADDGAVTVEFASGPATVKGKALADLVHGWAITVHRAQGSEFPAVVVVVPPEAGGMLSRPLVYTAMTRAQRHLSVVHAAGPALGRAVRQIGTVPRRTHLVALLREYLDGIAGA